MDFEVNAVDAGEDTPEEENKIAKITITGGWKYNINGAPMEYKVVQKVGENDTEGQNE